MLASVLALAIGLGSLALYAVAFLLPALHRKSDFLWSGVGLFYALVLWVCAGQIRGGILLGQTASVTLLGWFGWQMLKLRWEMLPGTDRPPLPSASSAPELLNNIVAWVQAQVTGTQPASGRTRVPQRPLTTLRSPGSQPNRPSTTRQQPVTPRYAQLDSLDALPEYELVEPEPVMFRTPKPTRSQVPEPVAAEVEVEPVTEATGEPIDQSIATPSVDVETELVDAAPPAPVPVPSVQPSTLKSRTKAAPTSSPVETAQAIFTSLKEGAQQFWRTLSGRKPSRPMIVLDRTKSTPAAPSTPPDVEDDFDFDFDTDTEDAIASHESNEVDLAPDVATAVIPEEATSVEEHVPEALDREGAESVAETTAVDEAVAMLDSDVETAAAIAPPPSDNSLEDSVDEWDEAIAILDPAGETIREAEPLEEVAALAEETDDAMADPVEIVEPSRSEDRPVLVRPNPPDPELVAKAIADAAEKDLPADPPDPAPDSTENEEIHPA